MKHRVRTLSALAAALALALGLAACGTVAPEATPGPSQNPAPVPEQPAVLDLPYREADTLNWPQFRGNTARPGITDAKTPTAAGQFEEKFALKMGSGWTIAPGTPIVVGDYLYVMAQKQLQRIDRKSGEVLLAVDCPGPSQFFSQIAYSDGVILVPRATTNGNAVILAYEESTLRLLWRTEEIGMAGESVQPLSAISVHNGYLYTGVSKGDGTEGSFVCYDLRDPDPTLSDEVKSPTWQYRPTANDAGFYWSGAAFTDAGLVFAGDNGELVSHDLATGKIYDLLPLGTEEEDNAVRSYVAYDAATGRVFAVTKAGNLFSVAVNADGTFDRDTLVKRPVSKDITSSPVVAYGRVYVGGGGIQSAAGFTVLDAKTLEILYTDDILSQASPIVSTAYATAENGHKVYVYLTQYPGYESGGYSETSGGLYAFEDGAGQTEAKRTLICVPSTLQYCTQTPVVAPDGWMYYYNDAGILYGFGYGEEADGAYTPADVDNAIARLPDAARLTLRDAFSVRQAQARYAALSEQGKAAVTQRAALDAAVAAVEKRSAEHLSEEIAALPEAVTSLNWARAYALRAEYELLSETGRRQVQNAQLLGSFLEKHALAEETELAAKLNDVIYSLPYDAAHLTVYDTERVQQALARLALAPKSVTARLDGVERIKTYPALLEKLEEAAAAELTARIEAIPPLAELAGTDDASLKKLKALYDSYRPALQERIPNLEKLTAALAKTAEILQEVQSVQQAIYKFSIQTATEEDVPAMREVLARYEALAASDRAGIRQPERLTVCLAMFEGLAQGKVAKEVLSYINDSYGNLNRVFELEGYTLKFAANEPGAPVTDFRLGLTLTEDGAESLKLAFAETAALTNAVEVTVNCALADGSYGLYRAGVRIGEAAAEGGVVRFRLEAGEAPGELSVS